MNDVKRSVKRGNESTGDGRKQRWRAHREARRASMVEAATTAIRRYGSNVGMEDIAREAGVSKPVLYRHFADQADLYVAVGQHAAQQVVDQVTAELDIEREPREHVAAVIDTYLGAIEREPELYRFVVRRSFADRPVTHDPVTDYSTMIAAHLTLIVGERLRGVGLDSGGAEPWGRGIVGMVQSAGDWWLDSKSMSRTSLTEYLTMLIWSGFAGILAGDVIDPGENHSPQAGAHPLRLVSEEPAADESAERP